MRAWAHAEPLSARSSSLKWTVLVAIDSNPWNSICPHSSCVARCAIVMVRERAGTEPRDWLPHPRSHTEDGPGLRVHRHQIVKLESTTPAGRGSTGLPAASNFRFAPVDPTPVSARSDSILTSAEARRSADPQQETGHSGDHTADFASEVDQNDLSKRIKAAVGPCRKAIDRQIAHAISSRRLVFPAGSEPGV